MDGDAWVLPLAWISSLAACLLARQPLTPAVCLTLSGNSSYGLVASPHERMLLDSQVKSRLGFRRVSSVAEPCEGLVVFIQAFFAIICKRQKHDTDRGKKTEQR